MCALIFDQCVHLALDPSIPLCLERSTHLFVILFADLACYSHQRIILKMFFISCNTVTLVNKQWGPTFLFSFSPAHTVAETCMIIIDM